MQILLCLAVAPLRVQCVYDISSRLDFRLDFDPIDMDLSEVRKGSSVVSVGS